MVVSGRINGTISISVEAYQLDAENSKARLREIVTQTVHDLGLSGEID